MLGALLDKLGGLLPKNFIIASFFPMLIFAFLNGVMLYLFSGGFSRSFDRYLTLDAARQTFYGVVVLIGVAFVAYVFSTLNLFLRETLEGKHFLKLLRLQTPMVREQQRRLDELERDLDKSRRQFFLLRRDSDGWLKSLGEALKTGNEQSGPCEYTARGEVSKEIARLKWLRTRNELIEFKEMRAAVEALGSELKKYPTRLDGPGASDEENRRQLDADHTSLRLLIFYDQAISENRYVEAFNEKEFRYSRYKVNATAMGNIAESVRSYARSRYQINLDPLWSRFQKLIQADEKFYASLLDAKTQLDFLVSLFWLTALFTAAWLASLLLYARVSLLAFLLVGVVGAGMAVVWYKIATRNYLAFADILRTSIDLFRFDLLTSLHTPLPESSERERETWNGLSKLIGYGESEQPISYTHRLNQ